MVATAEDTASVFLIDPQVLPDDNEVHLLPMNEGTQTALHLDLKDLICVVLGRGGCLQSL